MQSVRMPARRATGSVTASGTKMAPTRRAARAATTKSTELGRCRATRSPATPGTDHAVARCAPPLRPTAVGQLAVEVSTAGWSGACRRGQETGRGRRADSRTASGRGAGPGSPGSAGRGARRSGAVLEGDGASLDRPAVAGADLEEASPAGREVGDDLGSRALEPVQVDDVEVGEQTWCDGAAVEPAEVVRPGDWVNWWTTDSTAGPCRPRSRGPTSTGRWWACFRRRSGRSGRRRRTARTWPLAK